MTLIGPLASIIASMFYGRGQTTSLSIQPQEVKSRLRKDALGKIQHDAMLLESLKASSKICKFSTIEHSEIRMSSR